MSKLYTDRLAGKHIGVFFGTFAPAHLGHYQNIIQAKRETDGCLIIVSGYEGDRGDLIGLGVQKRFRYMRDLFAEEENVYVAYLDETNIPRYPDGWTPWLAKVQEIIDSSCSHPVKKISWYVGEQEYADELKERTAHGVRLMDRIALPISATEIRERPLAHWNYITRPFRRHFSTNILVMGSASNGKTTLVRDLARSFGAPFTLEYARQYEEESNIRDEELRAHDFHYLASGQFENNRETIQSASNNGLFFSDTDVMVTKVYAEYYLGEEDYQALTPTYDLLIKRQKWDLIFVIPPVTPYVDDSFRDMSYADSDSRWKMHNRFVKEIEDNGLADKMHIVSGEVSEFDPIGYYSRYQQARRIVKEYIKETQEVDLI